MNLDVALSAVQLKKHKTKAAVAMAVRNDKCSQLFALLVEKIRWFLSNRLRIDLFIAGNALVPQQVTIICWFEAEEDCRLVTSNDNAVKIVG